MAKNGQKSGMFTLNQFGEEEQPRRMLIGGLAYAPTDYAQLGQQLPGVNIVVDNPLHTGVVKWDIEWLRGEYCRIFTEQNCNTIISHSLGSLDAVHLKTALGKQVQSMIFLTPPLSPIQGVHNFPRTDRDIDDPLRTIDCVLNDLCIGDMSDREYNDFLTEHFNCYGNRLKANYKEGMPKSHEVPRLIEKMVSAIRSFHHCRVLALIGSRDVWAPKSGQSLPDLGDHSTIEIVDGAHYLHRVYPDTVARHIIQWENAF